MLPVIVSPRGDKINIFKPPYNVLFIIYGRKQFKTQVSNNNFQ